MSISNPHLRAVLVATLLVPACGGGEPAPNAGAPGAEAGADAAEGEAEAEVQAATPESPPDTEIYLARLDGQGLDIRLAEVRNATDRPGYDNQPSFLADGSGFLYTVVDGEGQADTWRYDLDAGISTQVTTTSPESEYSPTPLPGGDGFSAVRVEADSTQRLWRFAADGSPEGPILPDVAPVGYHAWSGARTLLLFVLGDPPTLQVADADAGTAEVATRDIGRSLQPIPGSDDVSFVQRDSAGGMRVMRWSAAGDITPLVDAPGDGEDHAWTPDGTLLMGLGSRLMGWRAEGEPGTGESHGGWVVVGDLADQGVSAVTRLAVSPDGEWVAVVAAGGP